MAEGAGGRRHRIDTVLVRRLPKDDAHAQAGSPGGERVTEVSVEDAKLVTLARAARARAGSAQGAAVRDADGRTYVAVGVVLASLQLTALQLAVAMAVSSGASAAGGGRRGRCGTRCRARITRAA